MTKRNRLTADALIKAKTREVELDGGVVVIKQMSARYAFEMREKGETADTTFQLIADMLVEPQLTVEQVRDMPVEYVSTLMAAIMDLSGLNGNAEADLKNAPTEGSTIS